MSLHHVDHGGTGPALVLLHAFPLDSGMFDRLVPLLVEDARVVTIDLPGLGESLVPAAAPSMIRAARAVVAVLDDLDIDRAVVLGISTGGYLALELAALVPGRLAALVLGSTTPWRIEPDEPLDRLEVADDVERRGSTEPVADSADEGLGATAHRDQPELRDELQRTIDAADPAGVAWMARAIADRDDTTEALATFTGPVVLLFGAEDTATPATRGEEMLAVRGEGSATTLAVLPHTGHLTPLEAPAEVAEIVRELLAQLP
ncbi:alpha/beta fold hydrolase [Aeromicrobium stalagmiti]|uniref:alpha/beta fold hydrolase n=1 Tax=Aeromicrobium stalagmiti TaxID=2738988 RepID=UPI00156975C3|nr:alpha/beta hydrolase [Aeromicrobium stalagmiti]